MGDGEFDSNYERIMSNWKTEVGEEASKKGGAFYLIRPDAKEWPAWPVKNEAEFEKEFRERCDDGTNADATLVIVAHTH